MRTLADETLDPGRHEYVWDGTDARGRRVSSGVYLYALRPESGALQVGKMTLVK